MRRYSGEKKVTFTLRGPVVMILSDLPLMFPTGRTSLRFGAVDIVKFSLMVPSMPVRSGRVRST